MALPAGRFDNDAELVRYAGTCGLLTVSPTVTFLWGVWLSPRMQGFGFLTCCEVRVDVQDRKRACQRSNMGAACRPRRWLSGRRRWRAACGG